MDMEQLRVGMVGFDITPRIHPTCGAWGTSHTMTEIDMPLLARCVALGQNGRRVGGRGPGPLGPAEAAPVWAGRGGGGCSGYTSRCPMPAGGCKFSRNYAEGLRSGHFY